MGEGRYDESYLPEPRLLAVDRPLNDMGGAELFEHFDAMSLEEIQQAISSDGALKWDRSVWAALCWVCHNRLHLEGLKIGRKHGD